jgi:hypothetical protein
MTHSLKNLLFKSWKKDVAAEREKVVGQGYCKVQQ